MIIFAWEHFVSIKLLLSYVALAGVVCHVAAVWPGGRYERIARRRARNARYAARHTN